MKNQIFIFILILLIKVFLTKFTPDDLQIKNSSKSLNLEDFSNFNDQNIMELVQIHKNLSKKLSEQEIFLSQLEESFKQKTNKTSPLENASKKENIKKEKKSFLEKNSEFFEIIDIEENFLYEAIREKSNKFDFLPNEIFLIEQMKNIIPDAENSENEFIIDFHLVNFLDSFPKYSKHLENISFNKLNLEGNPLQTYFVILLTNKSLILLDNKLEFIERIKLDIDDSQNMKSDFSCFDQENILILFTSDGKIHSASLHINYIALGLRLNLLEKNQKNEEINYEKSQVFF